MAFYRTSTFSTPQPQSLPSPSIVGRRLHKFRLRLTTASVCGTIDCSLRLPTLIPDTAPSSRCRARCLNLRSQTISAFPFRCLFPTPPASLRCRPASVPLSTRNHILLFRVVNAGALRVALHSPLSHTDSHVPPTHKGSSRLHPKPTALTPPPSPDGRCDAALTPLRQTDNRLCQLRAFHGTEGSANSQTASGF